MVNVHTLLREPQTRVLCVRPAIAMLPTVAMVRPANRHETRVQKSIEDEGAFCPKSFMILSFYYDLLYPLEKTQFWKLSSFALILCLFRLCVCVCARVYVLIPVAVNDCQANSVSNQSATVTARLPAPLVFAAQT